MARRSRPHQERVLACLQLIEPGAEVKPEVGIPQASRSIDGVMEVGEGSERWGVLRSTVRERTVLVEHWSSPPSFVELATAHFKRGAVVEGWAVEQAPDGSGREGAAEWAGGAKPSRAPLLLIISNGRPRKALKGVNHLVASSTRGIWASGDCRLGQTVLVDVKGLERMQGTSVLKLLRTPDSDQEIKSNIDHLIGDPMLSKDDREELLEAIMTQSPFTPTEQKLTVESVRESGRAEERLKFEAIRAQEKLNLERVRAEGLDSEGREALLEIARRLLGEPVGVELSKIEGFEALKAALIERLPTSSS